MFDLEKAFSSFITDPDYDGRFNGFDGMIMQSQQYTDTLIERFKDAVDRGYDPNDVKERIFKEEHIKESDLTDFDKKRLIEKIEKYYNQKNGIFDF